MSIIVEYSEHKGEFMAWVNVYYSRSWGGGGNLKFRFICTLYLYAFSSSVQECSWYDGLRIFAFCTKQSIILYIYDSY